MVLDKVVTSPRLGPDRPCVQTEHLGTSTGKLTYLV